MTPNPATPDPARPNLPGGARSREYKVAERRIAQNTPDLGRSFDGMDEAVR